MFSRNKFGAGLCDGSWCFITVETKDRLPRLNSGQRKEFLKNRIRDMALIYHIQIKAWVILDDHYHLLLRCSHGEDLKRFTFKVHTSTARQFGLWDGIGCSDLWNGYTSRTVGSVEGFWCVFNRIHRDPVFHGVVEEMRDYPFSSYHFYAQTRGEEWMDECFRRYPLNTKVGRKEGG